ncbi:hypothetical protein B481_2403 [Planococcus halocryophilus Or1]|uniref:Uncharacterized protein n=1 Tax=Planococcus halocryophilus TaxID=1215089 RepID=A0A1C7DR56_9BACL|nr:hypothetical protein [Planococcus halocryophilus]ANU13828.1 hypothetical protein BBI08_08185 [Planococcus halocryophilus]EMF46613.1 hypothetical protein B481_2403 [Planococcus halocryophilus Or1]
MAILTKNKRIIGLLLVFVSFLLIAGCSGNGEAKKVETEKTMGSVEKDKATIQAVIEKQFNGPDKKYRELWKAAMETQTGDMDEEQYNAWLSSSEYEALIDYMSDTYASYFTENAYDTFKNTDAFMYSLSDHEYKLSTANIKITQNEIEKTLYTFTFQVLFEPETGELETFNFDGEAIVPTAGKIGKIQFNNQQTLLEKITY